MPPRASAEKPSMPVDISNDFFHCLIRSGGGLSRKAGVAMYVIAACCPDALLTLPF